MDQNPSNSLAASTIEDHSESDDFIKTLLKRQIHTDVTINQLFSQQRTFIESASHVPCVTKLEGLHSVNEHAKFDEFDSSIEYLKSCGLTGKEIAFKLKDKISPKAKSNGFNVNPDSEELIAKEIERKLADKEESLKKADTFNRGPELSRQALFLEKAILERQNKETILPDILFSEKKVLPSGHPDDPINHLPAIISDIDPKPIREPRRERRRKRKLNKKLWRQQQYSDIDTDEDSKACEIVAKSVRPEPSNDMECCDLHCNDLELTESVDKKDVHEYLNTGPEDNCGNQEKTVDFSHVCDVVDKESQDLSKDIATKTKKRKKKASNTFTSSDFSCDIRLVTDEEIKRGRMSLSEILNNDKFQNYEPGIPSQIVYVKNLHNSVTEIDLLSIFCRFEQEAQQPIQFRLLNGRMKGQAFITFPDIDKATDAVKNLNGYILLGKPMILSFSRTQNDSNNETVK